MKTDGDTKHQPVRPTLVILLGGVVVPLVLLFGLALAFEDNASLLPGARVAGMAALLVTPVVFAVQIRSRGGWAAAMVGLLVSGAMLVVVVPLLLEVPGLFSMWFAGVAILGALLTGRNLGHSQATPRPSIPPRPDRAW